MAARAFERIGAPDTENEIPPQGAYGTGGGFGWWAWRLERRTLREGRPLFTSEWAAAVRMGVRPPEKVRVIAERRGSLTRFLRAYLLQCLRHGYANAALEREAVRKSAA